MSDISLNISISVENVQTRTPNNQSKKRKRLKKKRLQMENNDSMESKRKRRHKRRKSEKTFTSHQRSASEEGAVFAAPLPKFVHSNSTGNRYECLASTQNNNFLPSSSSTGNDSKPSTSTQNSISLDASSSTASVPESSFKPSGQNKNCSPSSSSMASSFKPSTSTQDKGLPQPSRAAGAPTCSHAPSASHSLPSSNSRGHYDSQQLWSTALAAAAAAPASSITSSDKQASAKTAAGNPTKYLAIDCEMVGTGPKGSISQLARCSVVNYEGDVVYDKFIKPNVPVTDYRTRWSGIRRCDLINATPYAVARKEILKLLIGKVVIGHAVHNDFKVLGYCHPAAMTRDTARIPLLNQKAGFEGNQSASLKRLTKAILNRDIQTGRRGHSSVEDAKATMELYKVVEEEWERTLASRASSAPV